MPALGGVRDDLAQVVLGVEPAVPLAVVLELGLARASSCRPSTRSRQAPISVSLGYASISTRQPWSSVRCRCSTFSRCRASTSMHLEDEVLRHEVPGDVEHHPAPAEPRRVRDPHRRHRDLAVLGRYGGVQQLLVRRLRVPQRVLGTGREPGAVRGHVDPVLGLAEVLHHRPDRLGRPGPRLIHWPSSTVSSRGAGTIAMSGIRTPRGSNYVRTIL